MTCRPTRNVAALGRHRVLPVSVVQKRRSAWNLYGPSRHPTGAIYELLQGEPATVSADELGAGVERLHEAVLRVRGHQTTDEPQTEKPTDAATDDLSPGSDYSRRGDVAGLLRQHGWSLISGDNSGDTKWRRPGNGSHIWKVDSPDGACFWVNASTKRKAESLAATELLSVSSVSIFEVVKRLQELLSEGTADDET